MTRAFVILLILIFLSFHQKPSAQETGFFVIESNVQEFLLVIDNDFENYLEVASGDTLELEQGERLFRMIAQNVNDNEFGSTIYADSLTSLNIQASTFSRRPRSSYNLITSENPTNFSIQTDNNSEIYIDSEFAGQGYFDGFLPPGEYDIQLINDDLISSKFVLDANVIELQHFSRFNTDHSTIPRLLRYLPGVGYISNKQNRKAIITYSLLAGMIVSSNLYSIAGDEVDEDILLARQAPIDEPYPTNELFLARIQRFEDKQDRYYRNARLLLVTAGLTYAFTTWDSFRKPKGGYLTVPSGLGIVASEIDGNYYPMLSKKITFK
jgi:hypothetical protein